MYCFGGAKTPYTVFEIVGNIGTSLDFSEAGVGVQVAFQAVNEWWFASESLSLANRAPGEEGRHSSALICC